MKGENTIKRGGEKKKNRKRNKKERYSAWRFPTQPSSNAERKLKKIKNIGRQKGSDMQRDRDLAVVVFVKNKRLGRNGGGNWLRTANKHVGACDTSKSVDSCLTYN